MTETQGELPELSASDGTALWGLERRWVTLIAVCGSTFMLLMDVSIVQVALPTIERHFAANFSDLQWVIDAYALALATLILTWGATSDRFGRKRAFLVGLAVFTVASLACGFATSITQLIGFRALQGIGGAAMFATGLALVGQEFHGREMGKAIAAWGATVGAAVAVGPLVGGILTSGLGWRWIFFVNGPIGVVTVWLSWTRMVNVVDARSSRLDVAGLLSFSSSMFLLVFGLIRTDSDAWTSPTILSFFAAAAVLMVVFVLIELHHARPMFDLSLFRKPSFCGVSFATFAIGVGMFAIYPYLTLYFQNDLGLSPLQGGLRLLPSTVFSFVVPLVVRSFADRVAPRVTLGIGLATTSLGLASMLFVGVNSSWLVLVPGLALTGIGIGFANPAIARIGLGVVEPQRSGMASGISNTFRIAGLATGVAALGAIFQRSLSSLLTTKLGSDGPALARIVASVGVRAAAASTHRSGVAFAAHDAFASALHTILVIGTGVTFLGAIAAFSLVRARDFHAASAPALSPEPVT
ncbi:MAG: MFS transporter [Acidimicrobiales bacterium]